MTYSTVTSKGQTTIPGEVRNALQIKAGDRLIYSLEGDHVVVRVHPGLAALRGSIDSDKGSGLTFAEIRERAAAASRRKRRR